MTRGATRIGAALGATALATLAIAPAAFADHGSSQATAQSLVLSIGGNAAVTQIVEASNDGSGEVKNNASTIPDLAQVLPENSLLGIGVAPQDAGANSDGTSFACAGVAGTGGGLVYVGDSACNLEGVPFTLGLGSLDLGNFLLGEGAIAEALNDALGDSLLDPLVQQALGPIVDQLSGALAETPLGAIGLTGGFSAIEATCQANPEAATGDATLADATGIAVTLPDRDPLVILELPANPDPNTEVLVELDQVTQLVIDAVTAELNTALDGALAPLAALVGDQVLQTVQDQVIVTLVAQLQPLLQPLQENVLSITLNKQVVGDGGRSIAVTALDLQVLPAAAQFTGSSLISGEIGKVTCGPNSRLPHGDPEPEPEPEPGPDPSDPDLPTQVDSGLSGGGNTTAILLGTGALMLVAGVTGVAGYRRMLQQ